MSGRGRYTDEQIKTIRRLAEEECWRAAHIGQRLGVSKNAIIGIAARKNIRLGCGIKQKQLFDGADTRAPCKGWTDAQVSELRQLYPSGTRVEVLAARFGRTLGAVTAKVLSLGLKRTSRARSDAAARPMRKRPKPQKQRPDSPWQTPSVPKAPIEIVDTVLAAGTGKSILDIRFAECRYPIGVDEEGSHLFCGAPSDGEKPYCAAHCAICYPRAATRNWVDAKIRRGIAA